MTANKSSKKEKSINVSLLISILLSLLAIIATIWVHWDSKNERQKIKNELASYRESALKRYLGEFYDAIDKTPTDIVNAENYLNKAKEININEILVNYEKYSQNVDSAEVILDKHIKFFEEFNRCTNFLNSNSLNDVMKANDGFKSLYIMAKAENISDSLAASKGFHKCSEKMERLSKRKPTTNNKRCFKLLYNSEQLNRSDELFRCIMQLINSNKIDTTVTKEISITVTEDKISLNNSGRTRLLSGSFTFRYGNLIFKDILTPHKLNSLPIDVANKIKKEICIKIKNKIKSYE